MKEYGSSSGEAKKEAKNTKIQKKTEYAWKTWKNFVIFKV